MPFFTHERLPAGNRVPVLDADGKTVGERVLTKDKDSFGIGRRQCTREYKIEPISRHLRKLLGKGPRDRVPAGSVEMWIGISMDEAIRMKPARVKWQTNRWPLIERRMSRRDCLVWLAENGYSSPPKSSCIGCPYHSDAHWREMRYSRPAEWADAVAMDRIIRDAGIRRDMKARQYIHRSCRPLDEVNLDAAPDGQMNLMLNECEGMCGV